MGQEGWNFIVAASLVRIPSIRAPIVFCMDLLFHLMVDADYTDTLRNLCVYSEDLIFIHTWKYNPLAPRTTDGIYQKYRLLENQIHIFEEGGFDLVEEEVNPNRIGYMYVFKKR